MIKAFTLPSSLSAQVAARFAEVEAKATKLHLPVPTLAVVREYTEWVAVDGEKVLVAYTDYSLTYEVLALAGGWRFLASIETIDAVNGEPRNRVSGPALADDIARSYCTAVQACQHCGHQRQRKQTYLLQDVAGTVIQVGSSCLQEHLGIDPAAALVGLGIETEIASWDDENQWGGGAHVQVFALDAAAEATVLLIAKNGYKRRSDVEGTGGTTTANDVVSLLSPRQSVFDRTWKAEMRAALTPAHTEAAKAAIQSLTAKHLDAYINAPTTLDSFAFKVASILHKGFADRKDLGILAAAVHHEAKVQAEAKIELKKDHLPGAVEGGKVELAVTVSMVKQLDSAYGIKLLVKLITDDGYVLTTFYSGSSAQFVPGVRVAIKGTVKKLEDSERFGKQTILTRVRVMVVKAA